MLSYLRRSTLTAPETFALVRKERTGEERELKLL